MAGLPLRMRLGCARTKCITHHYTLHWDDVDRTALCGLRERRVQCRDGRKPLEGRGLRMSRGRWRGEEQGGQVQAVAPCRERLTRPAHTGVCFMSDTDPVHFASLSRRSSRLGPLHLPPPSPLPIPSLLSPPPPPLSARSCPRPRSRAMRPPTSATPSLLPASPRASHARVLQARPLHPSRPHPSRPSTPPSSFPTRSRRPCLPCHPSLSLARTRAWRTRARCPPSPRPANCASATSAWPTRAPTSSSNR